MKVVRRLYTTPQIVFLMLQNSNLGTPAGPPSLIAALFIGSHIEEAKDWTHIDIAAPSWFKERSTAFGVPLLCALLADKLDVGVTK